MSIIELKNINLQFNDRNILTDFSLAIKEGEKVLISGKSGIGKSTIFRLMLGFLNYKSGEFFIDGKLVSDKDFNLVRKRFAYVNQDVSLRPGKVSDVLNEIAAFSYNTYKDEFDKKLAHLFEFDLSLLNKDTTELSGGERQRLGIILSIMLKRDIFLLDEVTSALDNGLKQKVVEYFSQCDKTVIAISHDNHWCQCNEFREVTL